MRSLWIKQEQNPNIKRHKIFMIYIVKLIRCNQQIKIFGGYIFFITKVDFLVAKVEKLYKKLFCLFFYIK